MADGHKPPPELAAEGRRFPGGWVYEIEGEFGPNDAVPPEAIRGAWAVDREGKLTGEYRGQIQSTESQRKATGRIVHGRSCVAGRRRAPRLLSDTCIISHV